jgi:hypothetical protein
MASAIPLRIGIVTGMGLAGVLRAFSPDSLSNRPGRALANTIAGASRRSAALSIHSHDHLDDRSVALIIVGLQVWGSFD